MNKIALLEGLLYIFGNEVVSEQEIKDKLMLDSSTLQEHIQFLKSKYESDDMCAFDILHVANGYKLVTKQSLFSQYEAILTQFQSKPLSSSAMETLAIIAYKQPITRVEIEQIRGVACDNMLRKLLSLDLIEEVGKAQTIGLPNLYGTTDYFLDYFKIVSIKELPAVQIEQPLSDDIDIFDSKYLEVQHETE